MNEKIKELAEQATRRYDRLGFEIPFAQPDLEEFAELIIQNCCDIIENRIVKDDPACCTNELWGAIENIKRNFGIESE